MNGLHRWARKRNLGNMEDQIRLTSGQEGGRQARALTGVLPLAGKADLVFSRGRRRPLYLHGI